MSNKIIPGLHNDLFTSFSDVYFGEDNTIIQDEKGFSAVNPNRLFVTDDERVKGAEALMKIFTASSKYLKQLNHKKLESRPIVLYNMEESLKEIKEGMLKKASDPISKFRVEDFMDRAIKAVETKVESTSVPALSFDKTKHSILYTLLGNPQLFEKNIIDPDLNVLVRGFGDKGYGAFDNKLMVRRLHQAIKNHRAIIFKDFDAVAIRKTLKSLRKKMIRQIETNADKLSEKDRIDALQFLNSRFQEMDYLLATPEEAKKIKVEGFFSKAAKKAAYGVKKLGSLAVSPVSRVVVLAAGGFAAGKFMV